MKIIFYDGTCGLCHGFVQFVLKYDKEKVYHLSPLEGTTAKTYLPTSEIDSIVLIDTATNDAPLYRSDAILAIFQELALPWKLLGIIKWLPKILRDCLYQLVARNRLLIAGKKACQIPSRSDKKRFLP